MATGDHSPFKSACLPLIPNALPQDLISHSDDTDESTHPGTLESFPSISSPYLSEQSVISSCDTVLEGPLQVRAPPCPKPKTHFKKAARFQRAALPGPETCLSSGDISMFDVRNAIKSVAPDADIACLCDANETTVGNLKNLMNATTDAIKDAEIAFLLVQGSELCFSGICQLLKRTLSGGTVIPVLMEQLTFANCAALCNKIATLVQNGADDVVALPASAADLTMTFSTSLAKGLAHRGVASNLERKLSNANTQCNQLFWQTAHEVLPGIPKLQPDMVEILGRAGDLVLTGLLAKGGFGEVHKCVSIETGEIRAVKVLSKRTIKSHSQLQQIAMEYSLLHRVSHLNVVSGLQLLHGVKNLYIVMEIAGQTNLYKMMKAEGEKGLPWARTQKMLFQIASGLAYLHEEGIAHCDLKPENVAISKDGCAKIVDFGQAVDVTLEVAGLKSPRGTMPFMPPEVLLLSLQWDPIACDLWQLGVIYLEILCGVGSFEKLMGWGEMDFHSLPQLRRCAEELMVRFAEDAKPNTLAAVPKMCDSATPSCATELLADILQLPTTMRLPANSVASRVDF